MSVNTNFHGPFVRRVGRVAATTLLLTANILQGQVSSISLTPPPGEYTRAQSVTATSEPAGATLHFTSNGTAPSSSSPRVFGALPINRSLTLRLQAFANGQTASDVFAFDFVITGQVAAGGTHTLALRADGTVWSMGLNDRGQLGDGTLLQRLLPVQVLTSNGTLTNIEDIATGFDHSVALHSNGTVSTWGNNQYGQLGIGNAINQSLPVQVVTANGTLTRVVAVACGEFSTYALKSDGTVWAWGLNTNGQLGLGITTNQTRAIQIPSLADVAHLAAGNRFALAAKSDGTAWSWGMNSNGQLGHGTTTQSLVPIQILSLTGIVAVEGGASHSLFVKQDGTLWASGLNSSGQLGDGTTTQKTSPVQALALTAIYDVAAGANHSLALKSDGTLWATGANAIGQLGDALLVNRNIPAQVDSSVLRISAAANRSIFCTTAGELRSAGTNFYGEFAIDHAGYVTSAAGIPQSDPLQIACGNGFTVILKPDGTVWASGMNSSGQLGDNTKVHRATPVQVQSATGGVLSNVTSIAAGADHAMALKADGTLWAWGSNDNGRLGDGTNVAKLRAVQVKASSAIFFSGAAELSLGSGWSLARKSDGTLWAWGLNSSQQLGIGSTAQQTYPVQVTSASGPLSNIVGIEAGSFHGMALASDGSFWLWGLNINGQLGLGSTITQGRAVIHPSIINPLDFSAGEKHTLVLSSNGTVLAAGLNSSGQLGDNSTTQRTAFVAAANLSGAQSLSAGYNHSLAIKAGMVFSWGLNSSGQLAQNSFSNLKVPTQVPGIAAATQVAAGAGHSILATGAPALFASGARTYGQFGDGLYGFSSTFVQASNLVLIDWNDSDHDDLPDTWEQSHFGGLSQSGADDPDGDGFSNFSEWQTSSDPTDYFSQNGTLITPELVVISGNNQRAALGATLTLPLVVKITKDGVPQANAPATFSVSTGGLGATTTLSSMEAVLTVRTDASGLASAYYTLPGADGTYAINVQAGSVAASFTAMTASIPGAPVFSIAGGKYPTQRSVVVTTTTAGAGIYYTLDGSTPGSESPSVASGGTIVVNRTATLQAIAMRPDGPASPVVSAAYQITGMVSAGAFHMAALRSDGTVSVWGSNDSGQLGALGIARISSPLAVAGLSGVQSIASGGFHTLALQDDGTVTAFGRYDEGQLGRLDGSPGLVPGLQGVRTIAAGGYHSLALKTDGTVWAWGANWYGQLGDGTTTNNIVPVQVREAGGVPLTGVVAISAGSYSSYAVKSDGTLWAWGANWSGQLGDSTTETRAFAVRVGTLEGVTAIAAGWDHAAALKADGTIWCWGEGGSGQLGSEVLYIGPVTSPVQASGITAAIALAAGSSHTMAILSDGSVRGWGNNFSGQLTDGKVALNSLSSGPQTSLLTSGVVGIAAGGYTTVAVLEDGTLRAFGYNEYGQMGDGQLQFHPRPLATQKVNGIVGVSSGKYHSAIMLADGSAGWFGYYETGNLYIGGADPDDEREDVKLLPELSGIVQVASGDNHSLALKNDGTVWAWGVNGNGQLGMGNQSTSLTPVPVLSGVAWIAAAADSSLAVKADGTVWAWGDNSGGRLGDGTQTARVSPALVAGLTNIRSSSLSSTHGAAVASDGSVFVWGDNANARLASGAAIITPQVIPALVAQSVVAGNGSTLALLPDGTLKAWGDNDDGRLGLGDTTRRTAPTTVPSASGIAQISMRTNSALALRATGEVLAWGANGLGQLGDGTSTDRWIPVSVPDLAGARDLACGDMHSFAVLGDATLRAWGNNGNQQLGIPVSRAHTSALRLIVDATDTNQNGVSDAWETQHFQNLTTSLTDDSDHDGLTNIQEYFLGTNPTNTNSDSDLWTDLADPNPLIADPDQAPVATLGSGNNQRGLPGGVLNKPLVVDYTLNGQPLANMPVIASLTSSGGALATGPAAPLLPRSSVLVRTDAQGKAKAFLQLPPTEGTSAISFSATPQPITFQVISTTETDSDNNELHDAWEIDNFGALGQNPNADPDGDGLTNLWEFRQGSDPNDGFNGIQPIIEIVAGNRQLVHPGVWTTPPVRARLVSPSGQPLVGKKVTISAPAGVRVAAVAEVPAGTSSLELLTDGAGLVTFTAVLDEPELRMAAISIAAASQSASATIYRRHDADYGLVARWKMDEASGTKAFSVPATVGAFVLANTAWVPGASGSALAFNGTGSLGAADSSALRNIAGELSISVRVKIDPDGLGYMRLFSSKKTWDHAEGWEVEYNREQGRLTFGGYGSEQYIAYGVELSPEIWHSIVVTLARADGSSGGAYRATMFVDGQEKPGRVMVTNGKVEKPLQMMSAIVVSTNTPTIGSHAPESTTGPGEFLKGSLDDLRIYNRVLQVAEFNTRDSDGDLLTDEEEATITQTDPNKVDTDGDGIWDFEEFFHYGSNPLVADTDGDGLLDGEELQIGTNPLLVDTDANGLPDGYDYARMRVTIADWNLHDDVWQVYKDGEMILQNIPSQVPNTATPAQRTLLLRRSGEVTFTLGRPDVGQVRGTDEYQIRFESPLGNEDLLWVASPGNSPLFGVLSYNEPSPPDPSMLKWSFTFLPESDADGDGLDSAQEVIIGTNPNLEDSDGDGMPDGWEFFNTLKPLDPSDASLDPDLDSVVNLLEYQFRGDPWSADSDRDLLPDPWEVRQGLQLDFAADARRASNYRDGLSHLLKFTDSSPDSYGDGLSDLAESLWKTNTTSNDSDSDTLPDGFEVANGLNPLLAADAADDADRDGLSNSAEKTAGLLIWDFDSDNDGLADGWELDHGLNPRTLLDGLQAWWRLDYSSAHPMFDSSGAGNDGQLQREAGIVYRPGPEVETGPYAVQTNTSWNRGALALRGKDAYASVKDSPALVPAGGRWTWSLLVKADVGTRTTKTTLFEKAGSYALHLRPDRRLEFTVWGAGGQSQTIASTAALVNDWVHVTASYDATAGTLGLTLAALDRVTYPAFEESTSAALTVASVATSDWPLIFGSPRAIPSRVPQAELDDIRLYNRMLTAAERAALAAPSISQEPLADGDGDGATNAEEYLHATRPDVADTDGDGLLDGEEIHGVKVNGTTYFSNPRLVDGDFDGLGDFAEVRGSLVGGVLYFSNPALADSDGDELSDGEEVLSTLTHPLWEDTDSDGMPDGWEVRYALDPLGSSDGAGDPDHDNLSNLGEYQAGTNPRLFNGVDLNIDTDGDGLSDYDERMIFGTNPTTANTFSGLGDAERVRLGLVPSPESWGGTSGRLPDGSLPYPPPGTDPGPGYRGSDDLDGDGSTNADESANGTSPSDPTNMGGQALEAKSITKRPKQKVVSGAQYEPEYFEYGRKTVTLPAETAAVWIGSKEEGEIHVTGELVLIDADEEETILGAESDAFEDPLDHLGAPAEAAFDLTGPLDITSYVKSLTPDEQGNVTFTIVRRALKEVEWLPAEPEEPKPGDGTSSGGGPGAGTGSGPGGGALSPIGIGLGWRIGVQPPTEEPPPEEPDEDKGQTYASTSLVLVSCDLAVDSNRDGVIKFAGNPSAAGAQDKTEETKPFRFWCNDDDDRNNADNPGSSIDDNANSQIESFRDLEDFTRLHLNIGGLQDAIVAGTIQVGLEWRNASGSPAIKVYQAAELDGGDQYLKTALGEGNQATGSPATAVGTVASGGSFKLPTSFWQSDVLTGKPALSATNPNRHLIFEGSGEGKGQLVLTFWKGTDPIGAGPGVWIDLKDIKKMYQSSVDNVFEQPPDETKQAIVFVHGWNMSPEGSRNYAETVFKRIWQRGFKGRFAYFRWATSWSDAFDNTPVVGQAAEAYFANYNGSEYTAWTQAGSQLKTFVEDEIPDDYAKNMAAHSMGNIVAGSALAAGLTVNNYALMQPAVPAACYDERPIIKQTQTATHAVNFAGLNVANVTVWDEASPDDDPDLATRNLAYRGMLKDIGQRCNPINFYLPADNATSYAWEVNNDTTKPPGLLSGQFRYKRSNLNGQKLYKDYGGGIYDYTWVSRFESMAAACRTWGKAAGAEPNTEGAIPVANKVNLSESRFQLPGEDPNSGFGDEHGGQFGARIQSLKPFYDELINRLEVGPANP